jgi:hypothetical protein
MMPQRHARPLGTFSELPPCEPSRLGHRAKGATGCRQVGMVCAGGSDSAWHDFHTQWPLRLQRRKALRLSRVVKVRLRCKMYALRSVFVLYGV